MRRPLVLLCALTLVAASPRFCVVTVTSLDSQYLLDGDGQASLAYSIGSQAMYAAKHNYSFHLVATVAAGAEPWVKRLDWKRHYTVRALLDGDDCDWVMATEGDVIITNLTTPLSTFVDEASAKLGRHAALIVNRDTFGNVNTGTFFVRRCEAGRRFLDRVSEVRYQNSTDKRVVAWGANGGIIVALEEADDSLSRDAVLLNSSRFNAYREEWQPGMFMRHFAAVKPKGPAILAFVADFPPYTWPGYDTALFVPPKKTCTSRSWFRRGGCYNM